MALSTYPKQWHDERKSMQGVFDWPDFVIPGISNRRVFSGNLDP
jgi:hypothetical protein